jgi:hypothetical protein
MTPEGKVKQKLDLWVKTNMPGAWRYAPPGGPFGKGGVGDRIYVWNGIPIMIETKADATCEATALQMKELKSFGQAGGIPCLLLGFQENKLWQIKDSAEKRAQALLDARVG